MKAVNNRALTTLGAAMALLAGCVVQDPSLRGMCRHDSDCDPGEVCGNDHICYGNPPATPLLATLTPPLDRPDLAPSEVPFMVTEQGDFVTAFAPPIEVTGRVVLSADPDKAVPAHLVFRRPSRIKGAPDYVVSVDSVPKAGNPAGAASFSLRLMATQPGESYSVTIYPDDTGNPDNPNEPTLAQLTPPYRQIGFSFETDSPDLVFPLGGATKKISGRVLDSARKGQPGLEVRAYGRFGPLDPIEVASSRGVTSEAIPNVPESEGKFTILVPTSWEDDFELRITPRPGVARPSIVLRQVHVDDATAELSLGDLVLPTYPAAASYWIPVKGQAPEGSLEPAVGARISLRTVLFEDAERIVAYEAQGAADDMGLAEVQLIPAAAGENREYTYSVAPVANTPHRSIWGQTLEIGPMGGVVQAGATLGARVLLSGQLFDSVGLALEGVNVQVEPSLRMTYELRDLNAPFDVSTVQFPSIATSNDGRFAIWVDPEIVSVPAGYILDFDPPADSLQPRWTSTEETLIAPDLAGGQSLGDIWLPEPAYVRGTLTTDASDPVPGAEIRLYEVVDDKTACASLGTNQCEPPAILRAQGTANERGGVRLVLPRP